MCVCAWGERETDLPGDHAIPGLDMGASVPDVTPHHVVGKVGLLHLHGRVHGHLDGKDAMG